VHDHAGRGASAGTRPARAWGRLGSALSALLIGGAPLLLALAPAAAAAGHPSPPQEIRLAARGAMVSVAATPPVPPTLDGASPADGDVLTSAPTQVRLTFSVTLASGSLTITGPDGNGVGSGAAAVNGATLSKQLRSGLGAGGYTVSWRAKGQQGPPVTGSYGFQLVVASSPTPTASRPAPGPAPTGASVVPSTQAAIAAAAPRPSASPGATATRPPTSSPVGLPTASAASAEPRGSGPGSRHAGGDSLPPVLTRAAGFYGSGSPGAGLVVLAVLFPVVVAVGWGLLHHARAGADDGPTTPPPAGGDPVTAAIPLGADAGFVRDVDQPGAEDLFTPAIRPSGHHGTS